MKNNKYIFTNKTHSPKSIMSSVLGCISVIALLIDIQISYANKGQADVRYATVCLLSCLFAFVGLILGIWGRTEKDRFYIFSYIGIVLNLLVFGLISLVLYAGVLL